MKTLEERILKDALGEISLKWILSDSPSGFELDERD